MTNVSTPTAQKKPQTPQKTLSTEVEMRMKISLCEK